MESDSGLTPYELRVKKNIEENQRVLRSLGLLNPNFERKEHIKKTSRRSNIAAKSRNSYRPKDESIASPSLPTRRTRRSSSILKSQGYDDFDDTPIAADEENTPPHKRKKIAPEPVFGPIQGVSVGDWWSTRIECSAAGVHRPTVAGIHGKMEEGCYSIALSGGYEDDIDYGEYFTYTGSGGRDLKGTKTNPKNLRTAPQTKDQVLEGPNAALALNIENQRPVRVIRGYKLPSPYAPEEGYRYDGLYSVERCWTATGLAGFKVLKYALKRLENQDPPPWISNGVDIPAHEELSEEECMSEDIGNTHDIVSASTIKPTIYLKSSTKHSPNFDQNIEKDKDVTMTENTQITPKRKRPLSYLNIESEESRQKQKSPIDSLNSMQNVSKSKNMLEKQTYNSIGDGENSDGDLNTAQSENTEQISNIKTPTSNCNGKKVRFSPDVISYTLYPVIEDEKYSESISSLNSGGSKDSACQLSYPTKMISSVVGEKTNGYTEGKSPGPNNLNGDSKKQASILNYFEPVKKTEDKRLVSRGILLRSNRRSFVSSPLISVPDSISLIQNSVPVTNSTTPLNKSEPPLAFKNKSFKSKSNFTPYKKRNHSSPVGTEVESSPVKPCYVSLLRTEVESSPVKPCHVSSLSTEVESSPVNPCHVSVLRMNTSFVRTNDFIGWDPDENFLGFDQGEDPQLLFHGFEEIHQPSKSLHLITSVIRKYLMLQEER